LQQISQSVPPPEKPSPHTARKKIKTQKLKKRTENTHQTKSKKEKTTPRRTRKRKKKEEQEKRHSGHSKSTDVRGQLSLPAQDLGNFPRPLARGSQSARKRRRDWW